MINDLLIRDFSRNRKKIESLNIQLGAYCNIRLEGDACFFSEVGGEFGHVEKNLEKEEAVNVFGWLERRAQSENIKYIAASVNEESKLGLLYSRLWLDYDIVPFVFSNGFHSQNIPDYSRARYIEDQFDKNHIAKVHLDTDRKVHVSALVTLPDYENVTDSHTMQDIKKQAAIFNGKKALFISATPQGGGVALMRHALMRFYSLLGLDVSWHVLTENSDAFHVTKTKFHNILQSVAGKDTRLTSRDKEVYMTWINENANVLLEPIKRADVIVIDDPQPSGLIPIIKKQYPRVPIIYRSHIQLESKDIAIDGHPANEVWMFLWNYIKHADAFVSHPVDDFIPHTVDRKLVHAMPPTTDPLDGLNKPLSTFQMDYYLKLFNKILIEGAQEPLDSSRPYIIQIARFDPSKGIADAIEAYGLFREKMKKKKLANRESDVPQLVLVGHSSVDDPDGKLMFSLIQKILHEKFMHVESDVKVAILPHIDQLLNTLLRNAQILLQLSHKEGYEIKVSEAIAKGKPVIVYKSGGIPLQVKDNVNGYLVDAGDTETVSKHLFNLFTNEKLYKSMSKAAIMSEHAGMYTTGNALQWLTLFNKLT